MKKIRHGHYYFLVEGEYEDLRYMQQQLVYEFLLESIMPGFRGTINNRDEEEILKIVVSKAHKDVMMGARYKTTESSINYCNNWQDYLDLVVRILLTDAMQISGRSIVEKIYF